MEKEVFYNVWMEIEKVSVDDSGNEIYEDITKTGEEEPVKLMSSTDLLEVIDLMQSLYAYGGFHK